MRPATIVASLLVLPVGLATCGDPLVDGAYRGQALFTLEGWVRLDSESTSLPLESMSAATTSTTGPLRVSLFWAPAKGSGLHLDGAVEQDVATDGLFPARFRLALFEPPEDDLVQAVGDGTGDLAASVLLAYLDADRDGSWDRGVEAVVGGAPQTLIVYTPTGVQSRLYGALAPGFHRLEPFRECVPSPDGLGFEARYRIDPGDIDLYVGMQFPVELLFDADCDGTPGEWTGVCPPLQMVRETCRGSGLRTPETTALCGACEPLLWTEPSTRDECDDWLEQCLFRAPPEECEREWRACRGEHTNEPRCDELDCVCRRFFDECLIETGDEPLCNERFHHCMTR